MASRMVLLAAAVSSLTAWAVGEPPPREIVVVDDVGVGDHFPSQVPGAGKYRLPPREAIEPAVAPAPRAEHPPQPMSPSEPAEWAAAPAAPAPAPAPAATPAAALGPAPVVSPAPAPAPAPAAVAEARPVPAPKASAAPVARDLEREILQRASDALLAGTCGTELPRLAELVERTDRADTKARGRILRARCFTHRGQAEKAKAEYLVYLRDFPSGGWVDEAREAVDAPVAQ